MSNPLGVYEALEAWQAGEITFKRAMRLTGARDVMELVAAARSSGVEIQGLSERDRALLDRAARYLGNRMDTIAFWQRADEQSMRVARSIADLTDQEMAVMAASRTPATRDYDIDDIDCFATIKF